MRFAEVKNNSVQSLIHF